MILVYTLKILYLWTLPWSFVFGPTEDLLRIPFTEEYFTFVCGLAYFEVNFNKFQHYLNLFNPLYILYSLNISNAILSI